MPKISTIFKEIDDEFTRPYVRLTNTWENKGRSRYTLANTFALPAIGTYFLFCNTAHSKEWLGSATPAVFLLAMDTVTNTANRNVKKEDYVSSVHTLNRPIEHFLYNTSGQYTRPILLASGIGLMAKGIFELGKYAFTADPDALRSAIPDLSVGYTLAGTASSMYVKRSDRRLLQKDSLIKKGYDKLQEAMDKHTRHNRPIAQTVPVKTYT